MIKSIPTLYEWCGGMDALLNLTRIFYQKVPLDPVLGPVFKDMSEDHPQHVAQFIAEVLGGPATYNDGVAGHAMDSRTFRDLRQRKQL